MGDTLAARMPYDLRDLFAGFALAGLASRASVGLKGAIGRHEEIADTVRAAYDLADAMVKTRESR